MKITAQTTSTGNYAVLTPTGELLKLSKRNQYNYCTLTGEAVADYLQKTAERPKIDIELTNDHVINEYFLTDESAKKDWQIEKLNRKLAKMEVEKQEHLTEIQLLIKYKQHFGQLPEYVAAGYKTEAAYQKHLHTELLKKLKTLFKLKTLKSVEETICIVYTTEYSDKNGGYKHFSRSIDKTYAKTENLSAWNRNKNLCVKKLDGTVIENRGNIEVNECN